MHAINIITLFLVIVGGINWLLVGVAQYDLVAALFDGASTPAARIVYILVGLSALWQVMPLVHSFSESEAHAQRH